MEGSGLKDLITGKLTDQINNLVNMYVGDGVTPVEKEKIMTEFTSIIPFDPNSQKQILTQLGTLKDSSRISEFFLKIISDAYAQREKQLGQTLMRQVEKWVGLSVVDNLWMDHLDAIDDLREGIGLRGYGQLDPLVEYKNEAFSMFERLIAAVDYEIAHRIFKVQVQLSPDQVQAIQKEQETAISKTAKQQLNSQLTTHNSQQKHKLGRNDPCWCGSGKKWKRCHYPALPA